MSSNTHTRAKRELNELGNIPLEAVTCEEVAKYLGPRLGFKFKPHVSGLDLKNSDTQEKFRALLEEVDVTEEEKYRKCCILHKIIDDKTDIIDKKDKQITKLMGLLTDEQLDSFCAENVITPPGVYPQPQRMDVVNTNDAEETILRERPDIAALTEAQLATLDEKHLFLLGVIADRTQLIAKKDEHITKLKGLIKLVAPTGGAASAIEKEAYRKRLMVYVAAMKNIT